MSEDARGRMAEIERHMNCDHAKDYIPWLLAELRTAQAEIAADHAREEKISQALEAVVAEERKLRAENSRLRAVVDAARVPDFRVVCEYPHEALVPIKWIETLFDAVCALDAAEGKTT